ncbi:MAG: hypothetical protein JW746_00280 [Candidatus Krumholzibacteriota bacterium]|nr:hypothetical protein [Candidatus Krumholzibacteriota bacterium]
MGLSLGIDTGTVSARWALLGQTERLKLLEKEGNGLITGVYPYRNDPGRSIAVSRYMRVQGDPLDTVIRSLRELYQNISPAEIRSAVVTGASARLVSEALGIPVENEFKAAAASIGGLYPDIVNIFEMGGENSKYIRIASENGNTSIIEYETNGDCAAGTGSFMDQQASRLCYGIEDVGEIVSYTMRSPKIAGRCSVFAKSDMIHAQQKGYQPAEVLKGLCEAVARNFKSNITKGRKITGRTAFIGGVAMNRGVAESVRKVFGLSADDFFVPDLCAYIEAIGSAIVASRASCEDSDTALLAEKVAEKNISEREEFPSWDRLSKEKVSFLRDRVDTYSIGEPDIPIDAYLGLDIGSVSTNLALITGDGSVIEEIYLRTQARPIDVVGEGLRILSERTRDRVRIKGVGATGSGRELIGELVGADTVNDEITAHKTGALFIGERLLGKKVDTIFEIGGQDSKYISIDDGIVVDFTMNEACAAGTGSFLEEQASKLDINIIDEFSREAFASKAPLRMGERCTVYMERDLSSYQKMGAGKSDLVAGLACSVVQNYLNRIVRGRKIGDVVFFQGGTAYNDSVAAAFSQILEKEIIVPPYNGVMGAIGAALLAKEKMTALGTVSSFRGLDISKVEYSIREFPCSGCTNFCDIQEFTVAGRKTYWGDKCGERYHKRARAHLKPAVPDLMKVYMNLLERDTIPLVEEELGIKIDTAPPPGGKRITAGIPSAMFYFDTYPFWSTFLSALGMELVTTPETNREIVNRGIEGSVAEPCAPVQVAHGHVVRLLEEDPDLIFIPNIIDAETDHEETGSYICPWGQTLPFVIRSMPALEGREGIIASPIVHFREGEKFVEKELWRFAKRYGRSRRRSRLAVRAAYAAQRLFQGELQACGQKALAALDEKNQPGIILVGRPYNLMDREINMDVPGKLRDYYGANVIPLFFLPLDGIDIEEEGQNMFWNYGRKILQAAKFASERENLHLIYITNFKCGPDSYVKHFCNRASSRPWLALQFDAHGNDAGMMTRCEAYLDSKGVLRWWKKEAGLSKTGPSTFPECPQEEPKLLQQRFGTSG